MGLIGFHSIGQLTARLARAVGMQVVAYDPALPPRTGVAGDWSAGGNARQVTEDADVISLHVPLLDATRNR